MQNIPVRDEEAKSVVRKGITASNGNKLLCVDYSAHEIKLIACFTKDRNLIKYIKEGHDLHRDQAQKIFMLSDDFAANGGKLLEELRSFTKSLFVFRKFYGGYYKSCARDLFQTCWSMEAENWATVEEHMKSKGIKNYDDFENHVRSVEKTLWETFSEVRDWQEQAKREYKKTGIVGSMFGFQRTGYLTNNMIINSPIQCSAFHCLLWSMIRLNKIAKRKWKTRIIAEIHDDIMFDLVPEEQEEVIATCKKIMVDDIGKEFDWLIVPLEVVFSITPINGTWYDKQEIKEK